METDFLLGLEEKPQGQTWCTESTTPVLRSPQLLKMERFMAALCGEGFLLKVR